MKKFTPTRKQKQFNFYLTHDTQAKLKEKQYKHHLSFSTLTECVFIGSYIYIDQQSKINLQNDYLDKAQKYRSTIKPRLNDLDIWETTAKKTCFLSNLMYLWVNKRLNEIIPEKNLQLAYDKINDQLSKRRETFWDNNEYIRKQKRALKALGYTK